MAIKGNRQIPNEHTKRHWMNYVKCHFDKAGSEARRLKIKAAKAKAIFPRPAAGLFRPAVRPPSRVHNMRLRLGKGFTEEEITGAGLTVRLAKKVGVAFDKRRRNRSEESLQLNIQRLQEYLNRLVVFPGKHTQGLEKYIRKDMKEPSAVKVQNSLKEIVPLPPSWEQEALRAITSDERKFEAFNTLKEAIEEAKTWGRKQKEAADAAKDTI